MRVKLAIMTGWMTRTALCIALLMSAAAPVRADEASTGGPANVPPPLFQMRFIYAGDQTKTTSKCIGNPITPLCVADTKFARDFFNNDEQLGEIAWGQKPGIEGIELEGKKSSRAHDMCYQLIGYWYHHEGDSNFEKNPMYKPGDVALQFYIGVVVNDTCDLFHFDDIPYEQGMLIRKGPYGWRIYNWHHAIDYVRQPDCYHCTDEK
ncbi:hypothetical protein L2D14_11635 [Thalassospiraceae bacterium LMO-JJ14]|nr:hypothetical protein L2D14_11635 [Thalassospiraceae bacterium LMO-JJ14]